MGEKKIWENNLVFMISSGWNLISFGVDQQPNKCCAGRVSLLLSTRSKIGEQPKSHNTDCMISDPNDSP